MPKLKTNEEIRLLKKGGAILAQILDTVAEKAQSGVTTMELDQMAEKMILEAGGRPAFKNYGKGNPYPATLCTSVNEELVHGIPSDYILKNGDILSLDIGMQYPAEGGLYTDMSITVAIGEIDEKTRKLMMVTKEALNIWIRNIKPGIKFNEIAAKVQKYVEQNGFSVIRDLVGHGVGHAVHEEPQLPNYYLQYQDWKFLPGMVLAFEPMVALGECQVETLEDGWTIVTSDGEKCAHYEHTIAVTDNGCEIITQK